MFKRPSPPPPPPRHRHRRKLPSEDRDVRARLYGEIGSRRRSETATLYALRPTVRTREVSFRESSLDPLGDSFLTPSTRIDERFGRHRQYGWTSDVFLGYRPKNTGHNCLDV